MDNIYAMLLRVALLAPPILLALTVHEAAHALLAWLRGDPTAKQAGRLSLNPLKHLDPAGTLVFFVTAWMGAGIGWAKPVPVDYRRLKTPKRDLIMISAAGPLVNLLCAALLASAVHLLVQWGFFREWSAAKEVVASLFRLGVEINVVLAFFNLVPLPPLDGSGILLGLLPARAAANYQQIGRYGFALLLLLIFLPDVVRGFPDVLQILVVRPAFGLADWLLP